MNITDAPHLRPRRGRRTYGVNFVMANRLRSEGHLWLTRRGGIVIYKNDAIDETDPHRNRHWLVPRMVRMEEVPGLWVPPPEFTTSDGTWAAWDWIRQDPEKRDNSLDPFVQSALFMRRIFFEIKMGRNCGRPRAFDIWPQPGQETPHWPWEQQRFKKG